MNKNLEAIIKRVGAMYLISPKYLRVTIGEILSGTIKANVQNKK